MRWLDGITDLMDMSWSKLQEMAQAWGPSAVELLGRHFWKAPGAGGPQSLRFASVWARRPRSRSPGTTGPGCCAGPRGLRWSRCPGRPRYPDLRTGRPHRAPGALRVGFLPSRSLGAQVAVPHRGPCRWAAGSGATEEGLTSRGGRNLRLPLRFGLRPQGPCRVGTGESGLVLSEEGNPAGLSSCSGLPFGPRSQASLQKAQGPGVCKLPKPPASRALCQAKRAPRAALAMRGNRKNIRSKVFPSLL